MGYTSQNELPVSWAETTIGNSHLRVSTDGKIQYKKNGEWIDRKTHVDRYEMLTLSYNGKNFKLRVHRLIAELFLPNPDGKPFVNHKDCNKTNNRVENLEWVTSKENSRHFHTVKKISASSGSGRIYNAAEANAIWLSSPENLKKVLAISTYKHQERLTAIKNRFPDYELDLKVHEEMDFYLSGEVCMDAFGIGGTNDNYFISVDKRVYRRRKKVLHARDGVVRNVFLKELKPSLGWNNCLSVTLYINRRKHHISIDSLYNQTIGQAIKDCNISQLPSDEAPEKMSVFLARAIKSTGTTTINGIEGKEVPNTSGHYFMSPSGDVYRVREKAVFSSSGWQKKPRLSKLQPRYCSKRTIRYCLSYQGKRRDVALSVLMREVFG